jgi:hypothetical protein
MFCLDPNITHTHTHTHKQEARVLIVKNTVAAACLCRINREIYFLWALKFPWVTLPMPPTLALDAVKHFSTILPERHYNLCVSGCMPKAHRNNLVLLCRTELLITPWLQSSSELYRPSDQRLSSKLVLIFVDRGAWRGQHDESPTAINWVF